MQEKTDSINEFFNDLCEFRLRLEFSILQSNKNEYTYAS